MRTTTASEDRFDFTFSRSGRHGTCLRTDGDEVVLERWAFDAAEPVAAALGVAADSRISALPLDDGRILLLRSYPDPARPHDVQLLHVDGSVHFLGTIPALLGAYPVPSPGPVALAFVVAREDPERSTIWRLPKFGRQPEPVLQVPGCLSGGVWLDGDARVLAANQTSADHRSSGIVIDLVDGDWRRIWSVTDRSVDRIVQCSPQSGLLLVSTDAAGEERLGWGFLGSPEVHFPEALHSPSRRRRALTIDGPGERVLLHEVRGAASRLAVYTPEDDALRELGGPTGIATGPACWIGDLVRFRFSTPDRPPTLATVDVGPASPEWSLHCDAGARDWAGAELVELAGPAGPIEAIVYGGPDWRRCEHLVVALHGGPLSAWSFEFDPLFQALAAAGIAVVAPNHRGSTGYGDEHLRAALARWGGPDLDDLLHLGRDLARQRADYGLRAPVVLGASYGAFLALLAACDEPGLWSRCVALAPFLSGPRLHADTRDDAVRQRITQLGGLESADDPAGPRDVLRACGTLTVPLLLVHGTGDLTIPVQQSRALVRRLTELGTTGVEYLEVDDDHTGVALARRAALRQRVARFCRSPAGGGTAPDGPGNPITHRGRR